MLLNEMLPDGHLSPQCGFVLSVPRWAVLTGDPARRPGLQASGELGVEDIVGLTVVGVGGCTGWRKGGK